MKLKVNGLQLKLNILAKLQTAEKKGALISWDIAYYPQTYTQSHTPQWYKGGGLMEPP